MREAEYLPEPLDRDRPEAAYLPEVVSPEVHEHIVLGELLLIREELLFQGRILRRALAARSRTGEREGVKFLALELHKCLGRSTGDLKRRARQEEEIGRGIQGPERPVGIE